MNNLKISQRLYLGFGCLLTLLLVVSGSSFISMRNSEAELKQIVYENNLLQSLATTMMGRTDDMAIGLRNFLLNVDQDHQQKERQRIANSQSEYDSAREKMTILLSQSNSDLKEKSLFQSISESENIAKKTFADIQDLVKKNDIQAAVEMLYLKGGYQAQGEWRSALQAMVAYQTDKNNALASALEHRTQTNITFLLSLIAVSVILSLVITKLITRSIVVPLSLALSVATRVAEGDLTSNLDENTSGDESGQLLRMLGKMSKSLAVIVARVREGAEVVGTNSQEILSGNLALSARTEQQAASLEETASAMEEMTVTIKNNVVGTEQVSQLAAETSQIATSARKTVDSMIATMSSINQEATKVSNIISVIDAIGLQTNLLALNAAVEAARAGVQGKGFAVVANEVRALSQRTSSAAREIKALVGSSIGQMNESTALVSMAGATMSDIIARIENVSVIINEIAVAGREQSSGIEQINLAIGQMDNVTQQNAALVEEAAAASQSLHQQAELLIQSVGVFKLPLESEPMQVFDLLGWSLRDTRGDSDPTTQKSDRRIGILRTAMP